MAKKREFRITRTNKYFGSTWYLEDQYTNTFVQEFKKLRCPTFPKKRAEQIVARLKAQLPPGLEKEIEYGVEPAA